MKKENTRTINDLDGTCVASCENWGIHLYIREQSTGWSVHQTPYEAILRKSQVSGYDNGPWPSDDMLEIPFEHILSVMDYEGKSFEGALKTQYKDIRTVFVDESLYDEIQAACNEAVKKVRRRIEDHLRKTSSREIFKLARELEIGGQELNYQPRQALMDHCPDIEWVKELTVQLMDCEENQDVSIPVSMIDRVEWQDGGWEIHCDNGWNYSIRGRHLYEVGKDA
jgi:hypothetical protein